MKELLQLITKEIFRFNNIVNKKPFTLDDMKEEAENLADIMLTQEKMYELLPKLQECSLCNEEKFRDDTLELSLHVLGFQWYFDNMHKNVEKIIQAGAVEKLLDEEQLRGLAALYKSFKQKKNTNAIICSKKYKDEQ